jgi:SAM-dependent methyltransferase
MTTREDALIDLGRALRASGYSFVCVTPETHRRVNARAHRSTSLRDVFGWSRSFTKDTLPTTLFDGLGEAGALVETEGGFRSTVRFSTLGRDLFVHSAYPTTDADAVFFGPDTYRFCAAIARANRQAERVVDLGCGSGAGGIVAARTSRRVVLADVSDAALGHARVNAALAGLTDVEFVRSDILAQVTGPVDFIVANPPYLLDERHRTYRDGGGQLGEGLSLRMLRGALERLEPGGTLLLYTGAAVVDGIDTFLRAACPLLERANVSSHYEELDPDVFGEELQRDAYAAVDRIAAVVLTATLPAIS